MLLAQLPGRGRVTDQVRKPVACLPVFRDTDRKGHLHTWRGSMQYQYLERFFASRNHTDRFVNRRVAWLAISKHSFLGPAMMLSSIFLFMSHLEWGSDLDIKGSTHSFPPSTERAGVKFCSMASSWSKQVRLGLESNRLFDFGNDAHCFSLEVGEVVRWVKYSPCKHKDL